MTDEVLACEVCNSSNITKDRAADCRSRSTDPDFYCRDCDCGVEAIRRPPLEGGHTNGRSHAAKVLLDMDPDDV